jgi:hypothetical protein
MEPALFLTLVVAIEGVQDSAWALHAGLRGSFSWAHARLVHVFKFTVGVLDFQFQRFPVSSATSEVVSVRTQKGTAVWRSGPRAQPIHNQPR